MSFSISGIGNNASDMYLTPFEKERAEEKREAMGIHDPLKKVKDKHDPDYECETCKNRKYQDGSDEMVSFKSAAHISPEASAATVRGHEQEHVSNAYKEAATKNAKVIQASVTLKTAICPECGRSYVAGGETRTQIKYYNEENPYQKDLKQQDASKFSGMNVDAEC